MFEEKRSAPLPIVDSIKRHIDELLDNALLETFPASDPISISCFERPANWKS